MMRFSVLSLIVLAGAFMVSCGSDGRDDTVLDMSLLTGKDWYYTWLDQPDRYGIEGDVLEVLRFESDGSLIRTEFGGRMESVAGKWEKADGSRIVLKYNSGRTVQWNVLRSGPDYIETMVDAVGTRKYGPKPYYLGELTADAFLVNTCLPGGEVQTYIGADVRGNSDVRDAVMLLRDGNSSKMELKEYYWKESDRIYLDRIVDQEVRFAMRIGKNYHIKLEDYISADNLPAVRPEEVGLTLRQEEGALKVGWKPFKEDGVWYRIEILPEDLDEEQAYFASRFQYPGKAALTIRKNTAGDVNRIGQMKPGTTYTVRLSALMFEDGANPDEEFGPANLQAVSQYSVLFVKE